MQHKFFSDGSNKAISWVIKTENSLVEQKRPHPDIYLDKVTDEQSRYIALHVGLFWGIGTFTIKNGDEVTVMLDSQSMYENLHEESKNHDEFTKSRMIFIKKLIEQRKLTVNYCLIDSKENLAKKLL